MMLIKGMDYPDTPPDLRSVTVSARLYPNTQARGLFVAVGAQQLDAWGNDLDTPLQRQGFSARVGLRNDVRFGYTGLEIGLFNLGVIDINDFDEDEHGQFPFMNTAVAFTAGLAI
jgi:hypothetical protein